MRNFASISDIGAQILFSAVLFVCYLQLSCPVLCSIFVPFSRHIKGMDIGELLEVVHPSLLPAMVDIVDFWLSCLHRMCPQGLSRLVLLLQQVG